VLTDNLMFIVYLAACGLIFISLGIPLLRGKIGRNIWYGIRFKTAFASDEMWYDLNTYGAKQLIGGGTILLIDAVALMFVPVGSGGVPLLVVIAFPALVALVGAAFTYRYGTSKMREGEDG
jgi:SdpI/YfhL protein family